MAFRTRLSSIYHGRFFTSRLLVFFLGNRRSQWNWMHMLDNLNEPIVWCQWRGVIFYNKRENIPTTFLGKNRPTREPEFPRLQFPGSHLSFEAFLLCLLRFPIFRRREGSLLRSLSFFVLNMKSETRWLGRRVVFAAAPPFLAPFFWRTTQSL